MVLVKELEGKGIFKEDKKNLKRRKEKNLKSEERGLLYEIIARSFFRQRAMSSKEVIL